LSIHVLKRITWLAILTLFVGGVAIGQASSAMAGTCGTPTCGGVVRNAASGHDLDIANCWQTGPGTFAGTWPPCVKLFSQNSYNAAWFITTGHTSTQAGKYYYDTDAFQAPAGCVTRGQDSGSTFDYDRRGKSALWIKIGNTQKNVIISSIAC
jgi:hypothetical protein